MHRNGSFVSLYRNGLVGGILRRREDELRQPGDRQQFQQRPFVVHSEEDDTGCDQRRGERRHDSREAGHLRRRRRFAEQGSLVGTEPYIYPQQVPLHKIHRRSCRHAYCRQAGGHRVGLQRGRIVRIWNGRRSLHHCAERHHQSPQRHTGLYASRRLHERQGWVGSVCPRWSPHGFL